MTLAAVVFDLDGTLIDSAAAVPAAYVAAVRELGGPVVTPEEVVAAYSVGPPVQLLGSLLGRPCGAPEIAVYLRHLTARRGDVRPYPGIADAVARLAARVGIAVFTGASRAAARLLLDAAGLASQFRVVVGGDEVRGAKPDPSGLTLACARLGIAPAAAAYVGDAPNDARCAHAAGALAVAAGWGHQHVDGAQADIVLASPSDLPRLLESPWGREEHAL